VNGGGSVLGQLGRREGNLHTWDGSVQTIVAHLQSSWKIAWRRWRSTTTNGSSGLFSGESGTLSMVGARLASKCGGGCAATGHWCPLL
jgi:hypothetical protein